MKAYEGMFLFDSAAASEWSAVEAEMKRLMQRASAEIIVMDKWDERRLAYEIAGRKRGLYVLCYFRAPADRIGPIERDVQLSELLLRCLILRADHLTEEQMKENVARGGAESSSEQRGGRYERGERGESSGPSRSRRDSESDSDDSSDDAVSSGDEESSDESAEAQTAADAKDG